MKKIAISLILIIIVNVSYSQEDEQLLVSEIKQSTVITEPTTLKKGFFKLSSSFYFGLADKIFTDNAKKEFVMENGWAKTSSFGLSAHYGLTNRLELVFGIPYERSSFYNSSIIEIPLLQSTTTSSFKLKGKGIGDMQLGINYQLIEGSKTKPSLESRLTVVLPTGEKNPTNINANWEYDLPVGMGEISISLDLLYRKIIYPYSFSFYGTFKYSLWGEKMMRAYEEPVSFKSGNFYYLGGSFNFLLNDWIAIQNDIFFTRNKADKYEGETDAYGIPSWGISYMPNINFQFRKFRFTEGIIIPLKGKSISADPLYLFVAQYIF